MTTDHAGITMLYVVTAETLEGEMEQFTHVTLVKEGLFLNISFLDGGMQLLNPACYKSISIEQTGATGSTYDEIMSGILQ